jgi:hypothetical protein
MASLMVRPTPIKVHPKVADPYILWTLARGMDTKPAGATVPILLELNKTLAELNDSALDAQEISIPSFYNKPEETAFLASRYCSALASWAFIENPPDWVSRLVLALPRTADFHQVLRYDKVSVFKPTQPILAVIDDGLDFLNPRYVQGDNTRFIAVWDQNTDKTHHNEDIQNHLQFGHSLEAYRRFFGYSLNKRAHGSAVLQMASKQHNSAGVAEHHGWPLLAVQLPQSTLKDSSGASLGARALDALRFVFDQASTASNDGGPSSVVVNLSMGADAGAHDGTSIFEEAMDELLALRKDNTAIVLPAGNAHDKQGHLSCVIPAGGTFSMYWHVPSQDATDSFLELWSDARSNLSISVTPPQGPALQGVEPGHQATLAAGERQGVTVMLANMGANTLSKHRHMALLALAPTQGPASSPCAQSGRYRIAIHNTSDETCPVQLWLERDGPVYGQDSGGKRGYLFKDPSCAIQTGTNDNTLNSIANGQHTIVVGATQEHGRTQAATYSGRSSSQPKVLAQGDEGTLNNLRGLPVQETVGQDSFRIGGTSLAAALASRWLMAYLKSSARPVPNIEMASDLRKAAQGQGGTRHPKPPPWPQKL